MSDEVVLGVWLRGDGPDGDIVISSRIRIARNICGFPLKARLEPDDEALLCDHLRQRLSRSESTKGFEYTDLVDLDEIERDVLVERHRISLEHARASGPRGVVGDEDGSVAVMVNEEDHLRVQVLASGLRLDDSFQRAADIVHDLESSLDFAFHQQFGYLTSCPTNVGTGMRISVMLHLPVLAFTKQIVQVVFNLMNDQQSFHFNRPP